MKKTFLTLALLTIMAGANAQKLWFGRPASCWLEALPIGNSHLGAMVYGGTEDDELQLNEETFWSGSPHDNNSKTSLGLLPEVRNLIFNGKEKAAADIINREFIPGPHGMRYLSLGSLHLHFPGHMRLRSTIATSILPTPWRQHATAWAA